jgi:hypothetical protein
MDNEHGELVLELETLPDSEELAALVQRLRAELLDLDVDHVEPLTAGEAPEDAKGSGAARAPLTNASAAVREDRAQPRLQLVRLRRLLAQSRSAHQAPRVRSRRVLGRAFGIPPDFSLPDGPICVVGHRDTEPCISAEDSRLCFTAKVNAQLRLARRLCDCRWNRWAWEVVGFE